eukprot:s833_g18.t2
MARAGEVLHAFRHCLFLPSDVRLSTSCVTLTIPEPKARYKAARHQSLKVDHPDLIEIIEFAFAGLSPGDKLRPMSDQSFRNRFHKLLGALRLEKLPAPLTKTLDLGSLRAGGATWLMMVSEDSELAAQLNDFLDQLPEVPRNKVFVDDSAGYQAYSAMNFGRLGSKPVEGVSLEAPDLGGVDGLFRYFSKMTSLAPQQRDSSGVPEGVLLLGGTFVVRSAEVAYAWADRIPGDYPRPAEAPVMHAGFSSGQGACIDSNRPAAKTGVARFNSGKALQFQVVQRYQLGIA